jgi:hypothetical protein
MRGQEGFHPQGMKKRPDRAPHKNKEEGTQKSRPPSFHMRQVVECPAFRPFKEWIEKAQNMRYGMVNHDVDS